VLAALEAGATTADEIGRAAALDPAVAAAALTELELAGLVREAAACTGGDAPAVGSPR